MKRERYSYSEILDDVTRYFTKIQTNEYLETGLFPIIDQGKEFITGYTNSSIGKYNDYPIIIFGDHTRIFKYIDFPCYLGADGVKALKNIKPDKINSKYLYYYLKNSYIPDTGYNRHFKWVKELFFNVHDIQTQKDIVVVLDKVTSLIKIRKEQLEKLDILVKSKFVEMFGDPVLNPKGWEKKKLRDYITLISGYVFTNNDYSNSGIPVIKIGNINSGYFEPKNLNYVQENVKLNKYLIYPYDIVISLTGTVGKNDYGNLCILPSTYDKYYLNQRNAKLELINHIDKYFLYHIFKFEHIKKSLTSISRGIRQANISNNDILNLRLPIPPLDLQNQFAEFVEQVEKNKENIKSSLNQLETLYNALMQEYFG